MKNIVSAAVTFFLACIFPGCSKNESGAPTSAVEPTDLEKNTKLFSVLNAPDGVSDIRYDEAGKIVSLVCAASATLRGTHSRTGVQASQQAAIWIACGELVSWMRGNASMNPDTGKSESESNSALVGVQVLCLKTCNSDREVRAILSFKPQSQKTEIGTLPKMTIRQVMSEVVSNSGVGKSAKTESSRRIEVNGVLVFDEITRSTTAEDGTTKLVEDYKQFFPNGKPNVEETRTSVSVPGRADSVKAVGIVWDESGRKVKY